MKNANLGCHVSRVRVFAKQKKEKNKFKWQASEAHG